MTRTKRQRIPVSKTERKSTGLPNRQLPDIPGRGKTPASPPTWAERLNTAALTYRGWWRTAGGYAPTSASAALEQLFSLVAELGDNHRALDVGTAGLFVELRGRLDTHEQAINAGHEARVALQDQVRELRAELDKHRGELGAQVRVLSVARDSHRASLAGLARRVMALEGAGAPRAEPASDRPAEAALTFCVAAFQVDALRGGGVKVTTDGAGHVLTPEAAERIADALRRATRAATAASLDGTRHAHHPGCPVRRGDACACRPAACASCGRTAGSSQPRCTDCPEVAP